MIETQRLLVRPWREADRTPFAMMCADPAVMEHLGPLWSRSEADKMVDQQPASQASYGSCFWAIEERATGDFLGFCGIKRGASDTPIDGLPEIGWRLARANWGYGFAREAASACLAWARVARDWPAVYAITTRNNSRSWGLMERLGMARLAQLDFDHPHVPPGDPLRAHVTYAAYRPGA